MSIVPAAISSMHREEPKRFRTTSLRADLSAFCIKSISKFCRRLAFRLGVVNGVLTSVAEAVPSSAIADEIVSSHRHRSTMLGLSCCPYRVLRVFFHLFKNKKQSTILSSLRLFNQRYFTRKIHDAIRIAVLAGDIRQCAHRGTLTFMLQLNEISWRSTDVVI